MRTVPEATVVGNPLFRGLVCQLKALSRSLVGGDATFAEVEASALRVASNRCLIRRGFRSAWRTVCRP